MCIDVVVSWGDHEKYENKKGFFGTARERVLYNIQEDLTVHRRRLFGVCCMIPRKNRKNAKRPHIKSVSLSPAAHMIWESKKNKIDWSKSISTLIECMHGDDVSIDVQLLMKRRMMKAAARYYGKQMESAESQRDIILRDLGLQCDSLEEMKVHKDVELQNNINVGRY